jgi:hypothetical protein
MGCGSSTPDKGDRDRSYAIDKQIEEDSKKFQKECKILLLGSSRPLALLPTPLERVLQPLPRSADASLCLLRLSTRPSSSGQADDAPRQARPTCLRASGRPRQPLPLYPSHPPPLPSRSTWGWSAHIASGRLVQGLEWCRWHGRARPKSDASPSGGPRSRVTSVKDNRVPLSTCRVSTSID